MSRRLFRRRRAWTLLIGGLVAMTAVVLLADRHLADRAPWRLQARHHKEVEALAHGHRYLNQGQFRHAIQVISQVREGSSSEAEALTIRGLAEAGLELIAPARRDLERAWSLHPNAAAARTLAAIYLSAHEDDRGLLMLMNAARFEPQDFRPWYAMGELVHLRFHRYPEAIEAFQEALQRDPDHLDSRIGLIDALIKSHRPEEAEPALQGVLKLRPDDPRVLTLAAESALELGRNEEAAHFLERSLSIDPDRLAALILHARLQFRRGHHRQALSEAERACALEPSDVTALNLLSSIQSGLGMKEQAVRTLNRRIQADQQHEQMEVLVREILNRPNDLELRCRLGRTAEAAGMKPLAIQCYQAALSLKPDYQPALQGLIALGVPRSQLPPAIASASGKGS